MMAFPIDGLQTEKSAQTGVQITNVNRNKPADRYVWEMILLNSDYRFEVKEKKMNVDEEEHAHRNYISLHEYFASDEGNYKKYFRITYDEREKKESILLLWEEFISG